VALEATQGLKTVHAIAHEHEVHSVRVRQWKKGLIERLPEVFGPKPGLEGGGAGPAERALGTESRGTGDGHRVSKKMRATGYPAGRATIIERGHPHLSIRRQCELLGADRGRGYRTPLGPSEEDLALMRWMDEVS
jgi:transposase-like protein